MLRATQTCGVFAWPFISVTTGALGGWAGHSWPQGSPDYVYDSRAIIRASKDEQTHTHTCWPRAWIQKLQFDVSTITLEDPKRGVEDTVFM